MNSIKLTHSKYYYITIHLIIIDIIIVISTEVRVGMYNVIII